MDGGAMFTVDTIIVVAYLIGCSVHAASLTRGDRLEMTDGKTTSNKNG